MTNFKSMREKGCNGCVHNYIGFMLHVIKIYQHFVNNQTPPPSIFFLYWMTYSFGMYIITIF